MAKSALLPGRPSKPSSEAIEQFVSGQAEAAAPKGRSTGPMKRLTIDVTPALHRRIKLDCAAKDVEIASVVRNILEQHWPAEQGQ